jgi:6-phosphogluconate dehydrogenase
MAGKKCDIGVIGAHTYQRIDSQGVFHTQWE